VEEAAKIRWLPTFVTVWVELVVFVSVASVAEVLELSRRCRLGMSVSMGVVVP